MFIVRSAVIKDFKQLFELSKLAPLIGLPTNKNKIKNIILKSQKSFASKNDRSKNLANRVYLFVLEDLIKEKVVGCCSIHAQHGTRKLPHTYLQIGKELKKNKFTGTTNELTTLTLKSKSEGDTEIGGLILHPDYRAHKIKLGKFLSFSRFLYMATHPTKFRPTVHSELMPPLNTSGYNAFWEGLGQKFFNLSYSEADTLSQENKSFILDLFPSHPVYVETLPTSAQRIIGQVGPNTLPVKKMLESIGFQYHGQIDPFDGGPHYQCELKKILPIKKSLYGKIKINSQSKFIGKKSAMIMTKNTNYPFISFIVDFIKYSDKTIFISKVDHPVAENLEGTSTNLIFLEKWK